MAAGEPWDMIWFLKESERKKKKKKRSRTMGGSGSMDRNWQAWGNIWWGGWM